jgi:hypothetical protein
MPKYRLSNKNNSQERTTPSCELFKTTKFMPNIFQINIKITVLKKNINPKNFLKTLNILNAC